MSASTSGMIVNHRALTGKLKRFNEGLRRLFELALVSPDRCLFESFTGDPLDRREIQTYSEWKVQTCFRNLNRRQKKRSKRRIIYILPVGPFPVALWKPVEGMEISMFELIANFLAIFFRGMSVKMMDQILITELNCKWRIHGVTGKLQVLVSDVLQYLQNCLPTDGYCIIGLTWVDLYPGDDWNFVLGESSCVDGCAVMSFGHFEPLSYIDKQLNNTQSNSGEDSSLSQRISSDKDNLQNGSLMIEKERNLDLGFYLKDFSDIDEVNKKMIWRLLRVTSHEICHVFGMSHCSYFACGMNESKSILQAESQPLFLCPVCLRKLQKALDFDIVERYEVLYNFLDSLTQCDLLQKGCDRDSLQTASACKFVSSMNWLNSMLVFIENKPTT